jgi:hypothetical protein
LRDRRLRARPIATLVGATGLALALTIAPLERARATPDASTQADARYDEGKALLLRGEFAAACVKLEESWKLAPAGRTAIALGACREGQGKHAAAYRIYGEARIYAEREGRRDRVAYVEQQRAQLEEHIGRVRVELAPEVASAAPTLTLDGERVEPGEASDAIVVDVGAHRLIVTLPGRADRVVDFEIAARQTHVVLVAAEPSPAVASSSSSVPAAASTKPPAPPAPPPREPARSRSTTRTVGLVTGAFGVASLAVGTYFGVRAWSLGRDVADACPAGRCTDPAQLDQNARAHRYARASDWTIAGGVVAIAAGAGLYLFGGEERRATVVVAPGVALISWQTTW